MAPSPKVKGFRKAKPLPHFRPQGKALLNVNVPLSPDPEVAGEHLSRWRVLPINSPREVLLKPRLGHTRRPRARFCDAAGPESPIYRYLTSVAAVIQSLDVCYSQFFLECRAEFRAFKVWTCMQAFFNFFVHAFFVITEIFSCTWKANSNSAGGIQ